MSNIVYPKQCSMAHANLLVECADRLDARPYTWYSYSSWKLITVSSCSNKRNIEERRGNPNDDTKPRKYHRE